MAVEVRAHLLGHVDHAAHAHRLVRLEGGHQAHGEGCEGSDPKAPRGVASSEMANFSSIFMGFSRSSMISSLLSCVLQCFAWFWNVFDGLGTCQDFAFVGIVDQWRLSMCALMLSNGPRAGHTFLKLP